MSIRVKDLDLLEKKARLIGRQVAKSRRSDDPRYQFCDLLDEWLHSGIASAEQLAWLVGYAKTYVYNIAASHALPSDFAIGVLLDGMGILEQEYIADQSQRRIAA